jgi:hypothetical protein
MQMPFAPHRGQRQWIALQSENSSHVRHRHQFGAVNTVEIDGSGDALRAAMRLGELEESASPPSATSLLGYVSSRTSSPNATELRFSVTHSKADLLQVDSAYPVAGAGPSAGPDGSAPLGGHSA